MIERGVSIVLVAVAFVLVWRYVVAPLLEGA